MWFFGGQGQAGWVSCGDEMVQIIEKQLAVSAQAA